MDAVESRARLAALIEQDGASYAALSRMLRRNAAYLQQYVRRGSPRVLAERDRALLSAYFRIDAADLGGAAMPMAAIRRLDIAASAGPGAFAEDDAVTGSMLLDPRLLDALRLRPDEASMLTARGDSMLPAIADGDTIVVDERDTNVTAVPAIFVLRHDGVLLVKRVTRAGAEFTIASDNSAYPPIATDAVEIVGRVVWLARTLR